MFKYEIPPCITNSEGGIRGVGVELELTDLKLSELAAVVIQCFGGRSIVRSEFEIWIEDTEFGRFRLEYDSNYLKQSAAEEVTSDFDGVAKGVFRTILKNVSAVEIVTPPIAINQLYRLEALVTQLRMSGAKGTRNQAFRALGLHFNPEVTALEAQTVLATLKAFLCLYGWLAEHERIDLARRVSPYIQPFPVDYVRLVVDSRYNPPIDLIIEDYIKYNPSRNRPLDMLPLFSFMAPEQVNESINTALVSARPTYHYRLPNSEVDDESWSLEKAWKGWVEVERLAADEMRLDKVARLYLSTLERSNFSWRSDWRDQLTTMMSISTEMD